MTAMTKRKFSRNYDHVPILYAGYNADGYSEAVMQNSCPDGMYFESNSPMQPKDDLFIKIQKHRHSGFDPMSYKAFRGKVKWCRQVSNGKMPRYGIGVEYTAKSHLSYGINAQNFGYLCDYCEIHVTDRLIHQTGLDLCQDCFHFMEMLPGIIGESMERRILGNVV